MTSRLERPSLVRRSMYSRVRGSKERRVMTMRHRAWLALRSPPRSRRWRVTLPEDASIGATPQRWAQVASDRRRSGLSPAVTSRVAVVSMPTPKSSSILGAVVDQLGEELVDARRFVLESKHPTSEGRPKTPWWRKRPGRPEERGRMAAVSATRIGGRQAFQTASELVGGRVAELAHLVHCPQSGFTGRALGHEQRPNGLDVAVPGLGCAGGPAAQHGPSRLDGVGGIRLALRAPGLAVWTVDLHHLDARPCEEPTEARSIGAGALHAHLGHRPEGAHPLEHRLVAPGAGVERLHAEHATDRVQGGGHVDVQMGVDTTDDSAGSFYDGHGHPFSPHRFKGWHGRPVKE